MAHKYGIDITDQRARKFAVSDFASYDRILVMDSSNFQDVMAMAQSDEDRNKVDLIMNYVEKGRNINVPDPYWDDNGFEKVYEMLNQACDRILEAYL